MARRALPRFVATTAPSDFRTHALSWLWIPTQWRGTTPDAFGPLSSHLSLSTCAVPLDPGESIGCIYPLLDRWCWLRLIRLLGHSHWRNEAGLGSLIVTAHAFANPGLRRGDCSRQRPVGYMANGSFHDELLSVHETQTVSLTHRISQTNSPEWAQSSVAHTGRFKPIAIPAIIWTGSWRPIVR